MKRAGDAKMPVGDDSYTTVPQTLEGWSILHQMFRVRRSAWNALAQPERAAVVSQGAALLERLERHEDGHTALFSVLGHKGDLMLIHFRRSFDELNEAELAIARCRISEFLEPTSSYLSMVELGLYEFSIRLYSELNEKGIKPGSPEWKQHLEAELARQREKVAPRLWPRIPANRYVCFYPMDKRRGEHRNWYQVPIRERGHMMSQHGMIGRRYAGLVTQIISGSIGFDDWEWGVDLFADDPLVFKKLIYEMRFDEASAVYAAFGPFYLGIRRAPAELAKLLGNQSS